jgi:hypothetical protein
MIFSKRERAVFSWRNQEREIQYFFLKKNHSELAVKKCI